MFQSTENDTFQYPENDTFQYPENDNVINILITAI